MSSVQTNTTCDRRYDVISLKGFAKWKNILAYAYSHRPSLAIFTIAVLLSILILSCFGWRLLIDELVRASRESPVGFAMQITTLAAVISMWGFELIRDWRASLPKYLSVDFRYEGKLRIRCRYAPLVGEGDARQMAQSLGKQVNNSGYLPIVPTFDKIELVEQIDQKRQIHDGKPFHHYKTSIRLTENIMTLGEQKVGGQTDQQGKSGLKQIPEDQYVLWCWPFDPVTEGCLKPCTSNPEG